MLSAVQSVKSNVVKASHDAQKWLPIHVKLRGITTVVKCGQLSAKWASTLERAVHDERSRTVNAVFSQKYSPMDRTLHGSVTQFSRTHSRAKQGPTLVSSVHVDRSMLGSSPHSAQKQFSIDVTLGGSATLVKLRVANPKNATMVVCEPDERSILTSLIVGAGVSTKKERNREHIVHSQAALPAVVADVNDEQLTKQTGDMHAVGRGCTPER